MAPGVRADQLDAEALQRAVLDQRHRHVERGLAPPIVGSKASGRSRSITLRTHSGVTGSM